MESSVANASDGYVPPATAFTVHFDPDTPKQNGNSHLNKFTRRHIRNLSLPIAKVYDNKVANEETKTALNGKAPRRAGNHSEGYFSSDTEEDPTNQKLFVKKVLNVDKKVSNSTKLAQEKRRMTENPVQAKLNELGNGADDDDDDDADEDEEGEEDEGEKGGMQQMQRRITENEEEEDDDEDAVSETGTYTIEKDDEEVTTARLNIDAAFGIREVKNSVPMKFLTNSTDMKTTWVNDWATQVVEHNSLTLHDPTPSPKIAQVGNLGSSNNSSGGVTKIPSPINFRSRPLSAKTASEHSRQTIVKRRSASMNRQGKQPTQEECSDSSLETESFLLATERLVSAMAARVSLSLDSGGESDVDTSHSQRAAAATSIHQRSDSSASESGHQRSASVARTASTPAPTANANANAATRYNRAFSLRRGRLDEPSKKPFVPVENVSKTKKTPSTLTPKPITPIARVIKTKSPAPSRESPSTPAFARTDCGRFSMRTPSKSIHPPSPLLSTAKKETGPVKKKPGSGGGRSNSTLSSKEVEFQNWKRRKSYDPMKAAAEGKKKEAAKKQQHTGSAMTNSATTPKSPVNSVLRSASFHGTRQLTMPSSSDEEEEEEEDEDEEGEVEVEVEAVVEDEDWPAPSAPRTSLESTPRGSRVSLYSNTSNSSLRTRPKLEGVDNLVISALSGLSAKLKIGSCGLLKKLRYLYDEDSPKAHQLSAEIEQLEASEPCSPQVKSPSRELSTTLRNLKRIESMIKVLDEVLFDEEEFQ